MRREDLANWRKCSGRQRGNFYKDQRVNMYANAWASGLGFVRRHRRGVGERLVGKWPAAAAGERFSQKWESVRDESRSTTARPSVERRNTCRGMHWALCLMLRPCGKNQQVFFNSLSIAGKTMAHWKRAVPQHELRGTWFGRADLWEGCDVRERVVLKGETSSGTRFRSDERDSASEQSMIQTAVRRRCAGRSRGKWGGLRGRPQGAEEQVS